MSRPARPTPAHGPGLGRDAVSCRWPYAAGTEFAKRQIVCTQEAHMYIGGSIAPIAISLAGNGQRTTR